jgi:cbb3-type cytochrome oxidase subunit 3
MDWNMVEAIGTWFAGIFTALALLLGIKIMLDDRKKEERAQAARFLIWSIMEHHGAP